MPPKSTRGGNGSGMPPRGRRSRGSRSSLPIIVNDVADSPGSPQSAIPPAQPDAELAADIAEATELGVDADLVEQLRLMTPRSRTIILSDLRVQLRPRPQQGVPLHIFRGGPPHAGANPRAAPSWGRHAQREARWYDPDDDLALDADSDHYSDDDDDDEEDPVNDNMLQRRGMPMPANLAFHGMTPLHLRAIIGGGMQLHGQDHLRQFMMFAQRVAGEARAMGADLDIDNMSYEELLELEERIGQVSKGLSAEQLGMVTELVPSPGVDSCVICMTDFATTPDNDCRRVKQCLHLFHDQCLGRWLRDNRRCPICNCDMI